MCPRVIILLLSSTPRASHTSAATFGEITIFRRKIFNILELKYDNEKMTPTNFYNQYQTIICNNLGKSGDIIKYDGNTTLLVDEKMTPMLEDLEQRFREAKNATAYMKILYLP